MTIYILSQDNAETAKWLDDKSFDKMIKDVAQVLCNVHWYIFIPDLDVISAGKIPPNLFQVSTIPLRFGMTQSISRWSQWTRACRDNYLWLVKLGLKLLDEESYRLAEHVFCSKMNKFAEAIVWARVNIPNLPERVKIKQYIGAGYFGEIATDIMPPLVMPKKYHLNGEWPICSYRNYYQAKLNRREPFPQFKKKPTWTLREKPEWIKL